jgi:CBS domain-containing protein
MPVKGALNPGKEVGMTKTVGEVMTRSPVLLEPTSTVRDAARMMRDRDIGTVLVADKGQLVGVLTDRDIVVRGLAEKDDIHRMPIMEIASKEITALSPQDSLDTAVKLMRTRAVRRFPVVDSGKPVGVLTIGDLVVELDPKAALADISSADANR